MRSQMASARIVSPIFSCQLRTLNWEQKMVEATLCRASMIHYTGRSTAAESLLNAAGHGAQFVRSRCSIWCGILIYLAIWELTKKWTMPVRNWGQVYAELDIMYPGRLTRN